MIYCGLSLASLDNHNQRVDSKSCHIYSLSVMPRMHGYSFDETAAVIIARPFLRMLCVSIQPLLKSAATLIHKR